MFPLESQISPPKPLRLGNNVYQTIPQPDRLAGPFRFTGKFAAPLTSPYSETDVPGTLTLTQTDGQFSTSGGKMVVPVQATPALGDLRANIGSFARAAGRAVAGRFVRQNVGTDWYPGFGWYNTANITSDTHRIMAMYIASSTAVRLYFKGSQFDVFAELAANRLTYTYCFVNNTVGGFVLMKGGALTNWTLIGYLPIDTTTPLYGQMTNYDVAGLFDDFQVFDLGAPFDSNFGWATAHTALPADGATMTGTADGMDVFTWTPAVGEVVNFMTRRTDDDNCWIVRCDQANSKAYMYQKQTGTETERGASGGVTQTFTAGAVYTIVIKKAGTSIGFVVFSATAPGTPVSYASATFNQTAPGIKISGFATGANLASLPRTLSGAALTEIDRFFSLPELGRLIIYDGDSLTFGEGATTGNTYPEQCNALLNLGATDSWHNSGVAGQNLAQINGHAYDDVDPYYSEDYSRVVLVMWGGTNSLRDGRTLAQLETDFDDWLTHEKGKSFTRFVVLTMLPRQDAGNPVDFEANRLVYNQWLKDNAAAKGYVVADVAAGANLQDPNDTTFFDADKVHLTDAGYGEVAAEVAAVAGAA